MNLNITIYTQGRRQKKFRRGGATEKTRPKNSTIKPASTLSVNPGGPRPRCRSPCMHRRFAVDGSCPRKIRSNESSQR